MSLNPDMSNFKADEEKRTASSTVVPDCIQQLPKSEPSSSELTDEQTSNAVKSLINKNFINLEYPKRVKFRVDPHLPGQTFALVSFIPSKNATPDKQGCFGVLKVRGTFPTLNEADKWAEHLVRNYDSYADIDFVPVGKDFPVMVDNTIYVETTREIDVRKKIEDTVKEHIKSKKEEEQREIETIQERQNKLLNEHKEQQQEEMDLDYYTQLRVKKANAQHMLDECHKRMKECNEVIEKTQQQIEEVDEKYPEYKEQYLEKYKKALQAVGADASKNPLIKYMDDSNSSSSSSSTSEIDRTQPYPTELDFKEPM